MPKSKRNQIVHLTQVKKKGKDHKEDLMKQVETFVAQFRSVFIFDFDSTKSDRIMLLRVRLKDHGRIFAGRNSLVTATLKNISKKNGIEYDDLAKQITGHRGLFFTDLSLEKLLSILDEKVPEFTKKLLGYAKIAPEISTMDVDEDDDDEEKAEQEDESDETPDETENSNKKKKLERRKGKSGAAKPEKRKKKTKRSSSSKQPDRHEVKFIKI